MGYSANRLFQLTRSRGAWLYICDFGKKAYNFNSHAHVERDIEFYQFLVIAEYFNSHAHVERDQTLTASHALMDISTHTLTWSVTGCKTINCIADDISTHTLTWSVTWPCRAGRGRVWHFNSHAHVERDLWGLLTRCTNGISTHTLTWSVTHHVELTDGGKYNFNSHAHVERDNMKWKRFWHDINFNSHAHVERDSFPQR